MQHFITFGPGGGEFESLCQYSSIFYISSSGLGSFQMSNLQRNEECDFMSKNMWVKHCAVCGKCVISYAVKFTFYVVSVSNYILLCY